MFRSVRGEGERYCRDISQGMGAPRAADDRFRPIRRRVCNCTLRSKGSDNGATCVCEEPAWLWQRMRDIVDGGEEVWVIERVDGAAEGCEVRYASLAAEAHHTQGTEGSQMHRRLF